VALYCSAGFSCVSKGKDVSPRASDTNIANDRKSRERIYIASACLKVLRRGASECGQYLYRSVHNLHRFR
jgi:hypothetical protein